MIDIVCKQFNGLVMNWDFMTQGQMQLGFPSQTARIMALFVIDSHIKCPSGDFSMKLLFTRFDEVFDGERVAPVLER